MGKIMRNIPIVVILVLLGSLVESLFILPSHLNRSAEKKLKNLGTVQSKEKISGRWLRWLIQHPYARLVNFCVTWRYATVACGVAMLALSFGIWQAGWIKFTFFPKVEGNTLRCYITMPTGTPAERTQDVVALIENSGRELLAEIDQTRAKKDSHLLEYSLSLIGRHTGRGGTLGTGGHLGQVWLNLLDSEERNISTNKLARLWRSRIGTIPDAQLISFRSEIHSAGNPIEIHLSSDDHDQLLAAADVLKAELRRFPGVFDVGDSFLPGKKELQLKLKPAARSLGLTLNDLARQVRHAFYGAEALRLQREKDEVKVLVRYHESERRSLGYIEEMRIRTPDGKEIPFNQVAEVNMEQGYATVERAQRRRVIKVTADVDETVTNANEVRIFLENQFLPKMQNQFYGLRYAIEGEGKEQKESWSDVLQGFAIALFCIYALLAIPFKSFTQPLIIMAAIPFGFVGAVLGHLLMGYNISILSLFGMVGLAGVAVNDSLVLVYAANRLHRDGDDAYTAVTRAGGLRFRAVILTSLTTFAGLTPMLIEKSMQAQFLIPMAVSLGFGVLFSTFITLLLIPCGYMIHKDIHRIVDAIKFRLVSSYSE
jgi:multidrug efflux pump subunit AcrB